MAQGLEGFGGFALGVFPTLVQLCNPAFGSQLLPAHLFQESVNGLLPSDEGKEGAGGEAERLGLHSHCSCVFQKPGPRPWGSEGLWLSPRLAEGGREPGGDLIRGTALLMLDGSCSPSVNTH